MGGGGEGKGGIGGREVHRKRNREYGKLDSQEGPGGGTPIYNLYRYVPL